MNCFICGLPIKKEFSIKIDNTTQLYILDQIRLSCEDNDFIRIKYDDNQINDIIIKFNSKNDQLLKYALEELKNYWLTIIILTNKRNVDYIYQKGDYENAHIYDGETLIVGSLISKKLENTQNICINIDGIRHNTIFNSIFIGKQLIINGKLKGIYPIDITDGDINIIIDDNNKINVDMMTIKLHSNFDFEKKTKSNIQKIKRRKICIPYNRKNWKMIITNSMHFFQKNIFFIATLMILAITL